jgi:hypothetical protein
MSKDSSRRSCGSHGSVDSVVICLISQVNLVILLGTLLVVFG